MNIDWYLFSLYTTRYMMGQWYIDVPRYNLPEH